MSVLDQIFLNGLKAYVAQKERDAQSAKENQSAGIALPKLGSAKDFNSSFELIQRVAAFGRDLFRYTPDPILRDWYTKPELAYKLLKEAWAKMPKGLNRSEQASFIHKYFKDRGISFDCDDYATFYHKLLKLCGFNACIVGTLVMPFSKHFQSLSWVNHVICYGQLNNEWWFSLDTNGLYWYNSKNGDPREQIKQKFGRLYNTEYQFLIDGNNPFWSDSEKE